ncbi:hypothetical protein PLICRDRAFT_39053 [Plicaturopsis crispa FD-325 SS-3]|nr:hypothetical protein PLICRDRAFT_39053 [Plicaturopsis crispa FD-325 SS-3]
MPDELAVINGIKPNKVLADGEEIEAKSQSSKSVYKVKRTFDHYYCSCPAWRNQSGAPVNARTCKHLRAVLGDEYEDARLALKNPDGAVAASSKSKGKGKAASKTSAAKPASKAKAKVVGMKRKTRAAEDDEDEDEDEEVEEEKSLSKPTRTATKRKTRADEDDEDAEVEEKKPSSKRTRTTTKRKTRADEDDKDEEVEEEKKPSSRRTRTTTKRKTRADEDDEDANVEEKKPSSKRTRAATKKSDDGEDQKVVKPASKRSASGTVQGTKDDGSKSDDEMDVDGEPADVLTPVPGEDELAVINGIKPTVYIKDGDETEVSSMSSNSKYKVKRTWDHYYCTCPAWRNQGGLPTNARTCKHLRALLGSEYEDARLKLKNPHGPVKPASKARAKPKSKGKDPDPDDDDSGGKPDLLLANKWDLETGSDPTGWWISEKLDGVRTYYDGKKMISRLGNPFSPPQALLDKLPKDVTLDGELFGGRGEFQSTVSIVKTFNSPHWKNITFQIFDVPSMKDVPFEERLEYLQKTFGAGGPYASKEFVVVSHTRAESREHVLDKLREIEDLGGEGLMLRKPESLYEGNRSGTLLKIKTFFDAEARVTGYVPGKGRHKGATGALKCEMASGKTFNVGSGLSDKQRGKPPNVGTIIVYRFQELTRDGAPRFPTFVGEAVDKTAPKDAEVPAARRVAAAE